VAHICPTHHHRVPHIWRSYRQMWVIAREYDPSFSKPGYLYGPDLLSGSEDCTYAIPRSVRLLRAASAAPETTRARLKLVVRFLKSSQIVH
jgi:hypothetical protein